MNILISLLLVVWAIVALLMVLIILMQRPKSEGLGAAFGGGVTENIFGAQTTTVLTKITGWLAGIFFALTFTLSILYAHKGRSESALSRELKNAPAPPPAATASASPAVAAPNNAPVASPAGSVKPSDQAVGVVPPASAPVAPSASPPPKKQP
jgi:preprotein translocase subunit SecG